MVVRLPSAQESHLGAQLLCRRCIFGIGADDMADRVSDALYRFHLDEQLNGQLSLPLCADQLRQMEAETLPTPAPVTIAVLHVYDEGLAALERLIDELKVVQDDPAWPYSASEAG